LNSLSLSLRENPRRFFGQRQTGPSFANLVDGEAVACDDNGLVVFRLKCLLKQTALNAAIWRHFARMCALPQRQRADAW
jgi:hypothetical protein